MNQQVVKNIWFVYLLRCSDGTYYTGCTNNLDRRVRAHNSGCGAKYTRGRRPVEVLAFKGGFTHSEALRLEYRVKGLDRKHKVLFLQ